MAYRGKCWVDPVSYQVVRLEKKAVDIPRDFPVNRFDVLIEYAPVRIAESSEQPKAKFPARRKSAARG